ncbi:Auxin-responsive protein SAUR32 [Canna indica]|uniref:Auxin-responsive protein SAUR32 n=1 Tax=Canna indica TaxID=4628 RepID=A0AAQ3KB65_9LILI|nr:Auxin-responsive protein SAUR32 [Canna indica]
MGKLRGSSLRELMRKLERRLRARRAKDDGGVPGDVKEGHFSVRAAMGEGRRFIVELSYLTRPEFLKLLEHAEEEFGFEQEGVLVVPCHPEEVQKILMKG